MIQISSQALYFNRSSHKLTLPEVFYDISRFVRKLLLLHEIEKILLSMNEQAFIVGFEGLIKRIK